jgi:hypothetical protein
MHTNKAFGTMTYYYFTSHFHLCGGGRSKRAFFGMMYAVEIAYFAGCETYKLYFLRLIRALTRQAI